MATKEEILRAAQHENIKTSKLHCDYKDERELQLQNASFRSGWIAGGITVIILTVIALLQDLPWENMYTVLTIMVSVTAWNQYIHIKNRRMLFTAIVGTLSAMWFVTITILTILGLHSPSSL